MSVFGRFKKLRAAYVGLGRNRWDRFMTGVRKFGWKESVRRAVSTLRTSAQAIPDEGLALLLDTTEDELGPEQCESRQQVSFTATQKMDGVVRLEVLTANSAPASQSTLTLRVYDGDNQLASARVGPVEDGGYTALPLPPTSSATGRLLRFSLEADGEGAAVLINPATEHEGVRLEPGKSPICRVYAENRPDTYPTWILRNTPSTRELRKQRRAEATPAMAVVSFGGGDGPLADSLRKQTHAAWELLPAADAKDGVGGMLRAALESTKAPYIVLARSSDTLEAHALHEVAKALRGKGGSILAYVDDDRVDASGKRLDPFFKPDYSPFYLLSFNYMGHFIVLSRDLAEEVAAAGATTMHDAVLRAARSADEVVHVRTVLAHMTEDETRGLEDGVPAEQEIQAIEDALVERGMKGKASAGFAPGFWSLDLAVPDPAPLVSIIIPSHDEADMLRACVRSILDTTTYPSLEILIAENNSKEKATFELYKVLAQDPRVRVLTWTRPFNFAAINNWAAREATGELLLLLNNDTTVITPDWLDRMVPLAMLPEVGAVGAKLLYPDDTIQHGGVVLAMHGLADHAHKGEASTSTGTFGRLAVPFDLSAVTGACAMMRRAVFDEVGGLDEGFVLAFNDVDLCCRIREAGYSILLEPRAQLYHYESKTRGYEATPEQQARFQDEQYRFVSKWTETCAGDPFYNPNLRYDACDFSVAPERTGENARRVVQPYYDLMASRRAKEARKGR